MAIEVPAIDRTLRSAKRYQQILSMLVKYGFEDIVSESGLRTWVRSKFNIEILPTRSVEFSNLSRAQRFRRMLEELGPTFIKIGQILSSRSDLIDPELASELKNLTSACTPNSFDGIQERLDEEFGDDLKSVFLSIEQEPIAAASLAQAHRAVLADGTHIVLKILRPKVEETIEADIEVLQSLARFVERYFSEQGYSPTEVVNEFTRELRREIDFIHEGKATDRLRKYFEDNEKVGFPRVYWRATTKRVLALEEIKGTLVTYLDEKDFTHEEIRALVENCSDAVFRQCFEFGYFHADPHAGNLMALPGGKLCFLDCGMTGRIDKWTSEQLANLISAVVSADLDRVVNMTVTIAGADRKLIGDRSFRADVWDFILRFENTTLASLDVGNLLEAFFTLLRTHKIRCPSDLVFLIKAVTTIEGVVEELDPAFDLVSYVRPYLENLLRQRYGLAAIKARLERSVTDYLELVEDLPSAVKAVLRQITSDSFRIKLDHTGLDQLRETVYSASKNISIALICAALMVGSSILILADRISPGGTLLPNLGLAGVITAVVLSIWVLFTHSKK